MHFYFEVYTIFNPFELLGDLDTLRLSKIWTVVGIDVVSILPNKFCGDSLPQYCPKQKEGKKVKPSGRLPGPRNSKILHFVFVFLVRDLTHMCEWTYHIASIVRDLTQLADSKGRITNFAYSHPFVLWYMPLA